jgi:hypothetical protein
MMHAHPSGIRRPINSHSVLVWATYIATSRYTVTVNSKADCAESVRTGRNRRGLGRGGLFGQEGTR